MLIISSMLCCIQRWGVTYQWLPRCLQPELVFAKHINYVGFATSVPTFRPCCSLHLRSLCASTGVRCTVLADLHCSLTLSLHLHPEGPFRFNSQIRQVVHATFAAGLPQLTSAQAFEQLEAALQETSDWYGKIERVRELISGIEKHRCLQSRCSRMCSSLSRSP